jgi:hypothetical protein
MPVTLGTNYHPMIEPGRPDTLPSVLRPQQDAFVALGPRPRADTVARLRLLSHRWRLWGSFAVRDPQLRRFATHDPFGLEAALQSQVHGATSMDVPFYGFFTESQRRRTIEQLRFLQIHSLEAYERLGIGLLPLVKGLGRADLEPQLETLAEVGATHAAFYARELLLEGRPHIVATFTRLCHALRLSPVLLGACRPHARQRASAVGVQHAVAARRAMRLDASGRLRPAGEGFESRALGQWVDGSSVSQLAAHNLLEFRRRFRPPTPLAMEVA